MKFTEVEAIAKGRPAIYIGREYVEKCGFRGTFEIDEEIICIKTPKMIEDSEHNRTPMLSKNGNPVYDVLVYIPFKADGKQFLTITKSPLIRKLIENIPVTKTETGRFDSVVEYHESIEGLVRFGQSNYKYGDKTVPVVTLEDGEK